MRDSRDLVGCRASVVSVTGDSFANLVQFCRASMIADLTTGRQFEKAAAITASVLLFQDPLPTWRTAATPEAVARNF